MSAQDFHAERMELERVLSSGIFDRSPSLAQVLIYICNKYFEGKAETIKEYCIAVDALGRSPEFEQKKDSIVRVQMHRLPYEMRLHFAEMHFGELGLAGHGGEASRRFGIVVNGHTVDDGLDVAGEVGSRTANVKVFRDISPAEDGKLHLP